MVPKSLMVTLYVFIMYALGVIVYWEFKKARKRRQTPFDPFADQRK